MIVGNEGQINQLKLAIEKIILSQVEVLYQLMFVFTIFGITFFF